MVLLEVSLAFPFHELVEEFFQEVSQGWGFSPFLLGLELIQDTIQPIGLLLLLCLPHPLTSYTQFFLVPPALPKKAKVKISVGERGFRDNLVMEGFWS